MIADVTKDNLEVIEFAVGSPCSPAVAKTHTLIRLRYDTRALKLLPLTDGLSGTGRMEQKLPMFR
ncbi:MAG: hypothetical protein JRN52_03845 [Nitrososphaerota archaeon]|nr:hypothetical protein [Nitrososphaerota archaeon]